MHNPLAGEEAYSTSTERMVDCLFASMNWLALELVDQDDLNTFKTETFNLVH